MKHVTSRKGLSYNFDETALVTPLLNPNNGILIGFWVSNDYDINFTYNDLYKIYLRAKEDGIEVNASDGQRILDRTYGRETHRGDGGTFYWLPSFV